ncbi:MAG: hypothetical protein LBG49_02575 [Mycoplasmataceae bacterium]|nr:hypothetical protein [Mycoplasmataceae bacterium]
MLKKIDGKLIQADHNPVKVGDNITIITNSSGDGGGKPGDNNPKPKQPTLRELILKLTERADKQDRFNNIILSRFEKIETRFDNLETRIEKIETRIEKIETRIEKLESS